MKRNFELFKVKGTVYAKGCSNWTDGEHFSVLAFNPLTLNFVKVGIGRLFETAYQEALADLKAKPSQAPSLDDLKVARADVNQMIDDGMEQEYAECQKFGSCDGSWVNFCFQVRDYLDAEIAAFPA